MVSIEQLLLCSRYNCYTSYWLKFIIFESNNNVLNTYSEDISFLEVSYILGKPLSQHG